jgi:hypothetical protein
MARALITHIVLAMVYTRIAQGRRRGVSDEGSSNGMGVQEEVAASMIV